MKAKTIKPTINSSFQDFYDAAPEELQHYIDRCAKTKQSTKWHPEGDCAKHIRIVFNRAKRTGDINFMLAAFFHDLGKADVTRPHPTKPDAWPAHGHEFISARLVQKYSDWIEELGGNPEIVHYIVKQHMRAQQIDKMRPHKQMAFKDEKYYELVRQFTEFDDMLKDHSNDLD